MRCLPFPRVLRCPVQHLGAHETVADFRVLIHLELASPTAQQVLDRRNVTGGDGGGLGLEGVADKQAELALHSGWFGVYHAQGPTLCSNKVWGVVVV